MTVEAIGIMWIVAIIVFSVAEAVTYQLVSIWFAAGSVGALIAYFFGADMAVQLVVFVVISAILVLALRPVSLKLLTPKGLKTNVDSVIGQKAIVSEDIDNVKGEGCVKLRGMVWSARSDNNQPIKKDSVVTVKDVKGVKLIVSDLNESSDK